MGGGHDRLPTPDLVLDEGAAGRLVGGLQLRVLLLVVVVVRLEPELPLVAGRWRGVRRGLLRRRSSCSSRNQRSQWGESGA